MVWVDEWRFARARAQTKSKSGHWPIKVQTMYRVILWTRTKLLHLLYCYILYATRAMRYRGVTYAYCIYKRRSICIRRYIHSLSQKIKCIFCLWQCFWFLPLVHTMAKNCASYLGARNIFVISTIYKIFLKMCYHELVSDKNLKKKNTTLIIPDVNNSHFREHPFFVI